MVKRLQWLITQFYPDKLYVSTDLYHRCHGIAAGLGIDAFRESVFVILNTPIIHDPTLPPDTICLGDKVLWTCASS